MMQGLKHLKITLPEDDKEEGNSFSMCVLLDTVGLVRKY